MSTKLLKETNSIPRKPSEKHLSSAIQINIFEMNEVHVIWSSAVKFREGKLIINQIVVDTLCLIAVLQMKKRMCQKIQKRKQFF